MANPESPGHHTHVAGPPGFGGLTGGIFGFPQQLPQPVPPPPQQQLQSQQIPDAPLFIAGARPKEKSWGELFIYNTGCSYGFGLVSGGIVGGIIGLQRLPDVNLRLRFNAVLNGSSKVGGNTANAFAVFAMLFSGGRWVSQRMRNGVNDRYNDVYGVGIATLGSGMLTHSVPRAVVGSAAVTGVGAAVTSWRNSRAIPFEEVYDLRNVEQLHPYSNWYEQWMPRFMQKSTKKQIEG